MQYLADRGLRRDVYGVQGPDRGLVYLGDRGLQAEYALMGVLMSGFNGYPRGV